MHYVETVTMARVKKVIEQNNQDNFIYCELMRYNEAYMDKIQAAESSEQLVGLWDRDRRKLFPELLCQS